MDHPEGLGGASGPGRKQSEGRIVPAGGGWGDGAALSIGYGMKKVNRPAMVQLEGEEKDSTKAGSIQKGRQVPQVEETQEVIEGSGGEEEEELWRKPEGRPARQRRG